MSEDRVPRRYRKRDANIETLRVLAMFMVIILHYLAHGGFLPDEGVPLETLNIYGVFVESFCIAAVNVWVLISGYFLSDTGVSMRRLLRILLEVLFYTVLITAVMAITGQGSRIDGIYGLLSCIFPISSEHYWFATAYVLMYLFTPVLNKGVITLSRRQLKFTIIGLLIWFCGIKSVVPVAFPTDDYGYGFGWFLVLYLIAAYIRKYDVRILNSAKGGLMVYVVSSLLIFAITIATFELNLKTGRLSSWLGTPFHYNYILCLTAALGLFSAFRFLQVREGAFAEVMRRLAPYTFGVYLLHEHIEIRDRWLIWIQDFIGAIPWHNILFVVAHMLASACIVFFAGVMIDFIRKTSFAWLFRVSAGLPLSVKFREIDSSIHINRTGASEGED